MITSEAHLYVLAAVTMTAEGATYSGGFWDAVCYVVTETGVLESHF
jgi:hypothetical protein